MSQARKVEARILEALDRVESLSTRDSGIRTLKDIVQDDDTHCLIVLKLSFNSRNRNIWKVVMDPIVSSILMNHSLRNEPLPSETLVSLLKFILNCISEQSCHAICAESTEKLYRVSRHEYVPQSILDSIPYTRSPGIAMCLLNISHAVIEVGLHVEKFATLLFKLHADNRYQFLYNEWILSLSEILSQSPNEVIASHSSQIICICVECSRVIMGESERVRLTRDVAMASCVYLSVVPGSLSSLEAQLQSISSSILRALRRDNLHLFALTRCFPKLRSAISAAYLAWGKCIPSHPITGKSLSPVRTRATTADSIRSRVIESVTQQSTHSSPVRIPPEPHESLFENNTEPDHERYFHVETKDSQISTRWIREIPVQEFRATPPRRVSMNEELESILESGTEEDLVEFLFVHEPIWASIIDDHHVIVLFHLIVGMIRESSDCPSVVEKLLDHLDACDERVARLANRRDIIELRDLLLCIHDSKTTVPAIRLKVRKTLQCMFAQ